MPHIQVIGDILTGLVSCRSCRLLLIMLSLGHLQRKLIKLSVENHGGISTAEVSLFILFLGLLIALFTHIK